MQSLSDSWCTGHNDVGLFSGHLNLSYSKDFSFHYMHFDHPGSEMPVGGVFHTLNSLIVCACSALIFSGVTFQL